MKVSRDVLCTGCSGAGCKAGATQVVRVCVRGYGVSVFLLIVSSIQLRVHSRVFVRVLVCSDCIVSSSFLQKCAPCDGRGFRVGIRQMGPMIQQVRSTCVDCLSHRRVPKFWTH